MNAQTTSRDLLRCLYRTEWSFAVANIFKILVLALFSLNCICSIAQSIGFPEIWFANKFNFLCEILKVAVEYLCYVKKKMSEWYMRINQNYKLPVVCPFLFPFSPFQTQTRLVLVDSSFQQASRVKHQIHSVCLLLRPASWPLEFPPPFPFRAIGVRFFRVPIPKDSCHLHFIDGVNNK